MSFGVQNLGVIDQRGTPAIWQSDYADFPNNFIEGRILIATDNGYGIYLDLAESRIQIVASYLGNLLVENGLSANTGIPNTFGLQLGGTLVKDTTIDTNGNELNFIGGNMSIDSTKIQTIVCADQPMSIQTAPGSLDFLSDGGIFRSGGTIDGEILSTTVLGSTVVVPNLSLLFKTSSGINYKILAEQI